MTQFARKSSLAGINPYGPADKLKAIDSSVREEEARTSSQVPATPSVPKPTTPAPKSHKVKTCLYLDADIYERVRGATHLANDNASDASEKIVSYSDFVNRAILQFVQHVEYRYNHGQPARVATGEGMRGRPRQSADTSS
jgi:hypothetical protein